VWLSSLWIEIITPPEPNEPNLLGNLVFVVALFSFSLVGWLITVRRPMSRIGWLCAWVGFVWAISAGADTYAIFSLHEGHGSVLLGRIAVVLSDMTWIPAIGLMGIFLVLLFPDGRPPSPRWRWVLYVGGGSLAIMSVLALLSPGDYADSGFPNVTNPLAVDALKVLDPLFYALLPVLPLSMIAALVGLVVRYRRSTGSERLQLKWLVAAGAFVAVLYAFMMVSFAFVPEGWSTWLGSLMIGSFGFIPAAIGAAILKHRLYDIDIVINKALVYGSLAAIITIVYVGIVVGVGQAIGSPDNLGLSILATALVAVGFQPLRDRVQRIANRLIYGKRATPYEVMSEFSGGIAQIAAIEELLPKMARLVGEATGASSSEVWLRIGQEFVRDATWPHEDEVDPISLSADGALETIRLQATAALPVRHREEMLGIIAITKAPGDPLRAADEKLLDDLASQAGLVLRNVTLIEDLKTSRRRLVSAADEERRKLERDLHDGAQQRLVSIALALKMARNQVDDEHPELIERIDQAAEQLTLALKELREFAQGIHPAILSERGLEAALQSLAERSTVPASIHTSLKGRLPAPVETTAYFVVSEALANVAKYSQAEAVDIKLEQQNGSLELVVEDDGMGGADPMRGSGLRGLQDRVSVVNGSLDVYSPQGQGTRLMCRIPVGQAH
jgi:signal transduction histidine kinase